MQPGDGPLFTERTPRVVAARKLTRRAHRDKTRRFLAEGPQAVSEAVRLPDVEVFATPEAAARYDDMLQGVRVHLATEQALAGLSETVTPQGIVAVCSFIDVPLAGLRPSLVSVLVEANEPGNAGTVLRTSDAAGAGAVVLTDGSVDVYNGKCVRASAGSLFHLPVVRGGDVTEIIGTLRAAGVRVLAATGDGEADLFEEARSGRLAEPTAWLFGNEARGLPDTVATLADARVRVPIFGQAESLNLAAAAAVCLYTTASSQR
ncbi:TrmH family RNA methyltransferase [Fodinicola acaciae]|uniref:TrmH family RNA methyltransferase n=1 Tax=Fodinicola acaciae TaxID=2681555 RepID=UPI0013D79B7F|nr:RNA methyltransferase [Fodinicola acaciae]